MCLQGKTGSGIRDTVSVSNLAQAPSPKRFSAAFLAPKGGDYGAGKNKQSDWRSIEGSRRHRARIGGYHGRSA
jgi:hypothetical protein